MKILIASLSTIPVKLYGGTNRVIWSLGKELSKMGHQITYLVPKGSRCDFGTVIPIDPRKDISEQIPADVDIVHFNMQIKDAEKIEKPYIITMHGNTRPGTLLNRNTVFVSENHATRHGSGSYVYNGLDWDEYSKPNLTLERKYFHFLAKAAWRVKNVVGAIDCIKNTPEEQLKVLGGVRFNFKMGIRFTFSNRVKFYGQVGGEKKDSLINGSKGLVFPVKWHEPFGLAIIESLYFGCPVFGTPYGSLPELINEEVGFLSNKRTELTDAILSADRFDKIKCHNYARDEFNSKKMALNYLEKYDLVLNNNFLNEEEPQLINQSYNKFLSWED